MNTLEEIAPATPATSDKEGIQLPFGLLGFERVKNYALLTRPGEEPFLWLQMLEDSKQAFLVVPPHMVLTGYNPDISEDDVAFLDLHDPADAFVLNIVTLRGPRQATVNLKGPIVINRRTLIGKQVIPVNAAQFAIRHPLPA
jgi:flagellar assembly factor FliW